jgi:hypothetical protein
MMRESPEAQPPGAELASDWAKQEHGATGLEQTVSITIHSRRHLQLASSRDSAHSHCPTGEITCSSGCCHPHCNLVGGPPCFSATTRVPTAARLLRYYWELCSGVSMAQRSRAANQCLDMNRGLAYGCTRSVLEPANTVWLSLINNPIQTRRGWSSSLHCSPGFVCPLWHSPSAGNFGLGRGRDSSAHAPP